MNKKGKLKTVFFADLCVQLMEYGDGFSKFIHAHIKKCTVKILILNPLPASVLFCTFWKMLDNNGWPLTLHEHKLLVNRKCILNRDHFNNIYTI